MKPNSINSSGPFITWDVPARPRAALAQAGLILSISSLIPVLQSPAEAGMGTDPSHSCPWEGPSVLAWFVSWAKVWGGLVGWNDIVA